MARTATWGVPLSGWHTFPPCGVRLCCTVQRVVQACTATTLEGDYAALLMSCGHTLQLYGVARGAAAYLGTVWHALPRCTLIWYCVARGATGYFGTHCHYVVFGTLCYVVFIFCREILPGLQLWEQEMDEAWHALPLGVPRCHTGKHCHRVVFDCAALCNVLCRHAPPLRWRETAVVFILCWHTLPLYWLAHSAIVLCLACIANESCDSCRAGATTSPLIIILCLQHTAFLLFTSSLIIILCLQHTTFLLFTPFLVRNVIVRGSRYRCCLGYRLLFPYMILFKLYIYWKKNNIGLSLTQASVVVPSKVIQAQVCSTRVRETNPRFRPELSRNLRKPQQLGAPAHLPIHPSINRLRRQHFHPQTEAAAPSSTD